MPHGAAQGIPGLNGQLALASVQQQVARDPVPSNPALEAPSPVLPSAVKKMKTAFTIIQKMYMY